MGHFYRQKYSAFICIILCIFLSCVPRANHWGLPQYEYNYQIPEKIDDGWETSSLTEAGVNSEIINALMGNILKGNLPNIHSILLIKNGKLVLEEYFYGYTRNAKHNMKSATKSITSILLGIAIDHQMIPNVSTKVHEFFPEYKRTKWVQDKYDINLKHLLTMTAGLDWNEEKYPYGDIRNTNTAMNRSDNPIKFVLNLRFAETPGKKFNYCGGLSLLLGGIIKNTSGLYADKFAEKYLFEPLGITEYRWERYNDGTIATHGNIFMKPRDMAKIGQMMLKRGQWKDKQIVSRIWVEESTKAYTSGNVLFGSGYAGHWWCGNRKINDQMIVDAFYATGKGGQYIFVVPEMDLVTIVTSKSDSNSLGVFRAAAMLVDYIIPAMLPLTLRKTIKLNQKALEKYVGKYKSKFVDDPIVIFERGDKLFFPTLNGETVELFAKTEYQFFGVWKGLGNVLMNFIEDEKRAIKGLIIHIGFTRIQFEKIKNK